MLTEWDELALSELGDFKNGLNKGKEDFGFGTKFVNIQDIYRSPIIDLDHLNRVNVTEQEINNYKLQDDDIIFVRSSVKPEGVGYPGLIVNIGKEEVVHSGFTIRFRQNKRTVHPKFLLFYLQSTEFRNRLLPLSTISANTNINQDSLSRLTIKLPPISEQCKIADILTSVDNVISNTETIIEQTEKIKKGLMQRLLTKGIGHTKFKQTEIGKIPENWKINRLVDVCEVNPNYKISKGTMCSYVEMGAVQTNSPDISYYLTREAGGGGSRFKEGDVLFARITPCTENGKTALVSGLNSEIGLGSTELIVLSPIKGELDSRYLYYLMKSDGVRNYAIGRMTGTTGRQRVPNEVFKNELVIAVPGIQEQINIASIFSSFDEKVEKEQVKLKQLQTLKKGLMQVLFTGKIRVKVDDQEAVTT